MTHKEIAVQAAQESYFLAADSATGKVICACTEAIVYALLAIADALKKEGA